MKTGDKVICIDSFGTLSLKNGKEYTVSRVYKDSLYLELGLFEENGFRIDRFETILSYERKKKLKKINNDL